VPDPPRELPIAATPSPRRDAVANRARILSAVRELLADPEAGSLSLDAVAARAGVGKGTIFRRFGDRIGLLAAILDETTRELQDAMLAGPPPLGPGAPPVERLVAFADALAGLVLENLPVLMALEGSGPRESIRAIAPFVLHARTLFAQADPDADAEALAGLLVGALAAPSVAALVHDREVSPERVRASARRLAASLATAP
jgi:AcrR family transcriptional regulator